MCFLNLANIFGIKDCRSPPQFLFDANHFHIEATLDTTDSDNLSKHFSYFLQRKMLVVTLLQVFPNLFPCVYIVQFQMFTQGKV